jgi:hypothetical protein
MSARRVTVPDVPRRTTLGTATWLALIAASALIASCGGSSSTSSTASTASTGQSGSLTVGHSARMRAGGTTLVVTVPRVAFPLRGSGALLGPGDRAAGVEVTVHNTGHGVYDSSSESDVSLRTTVGGQAVPAFASSGQCATSEIDFLKLVQPGESRSGCVVYDVPQGARPAAVRFAPEGHAALGRTWAIAG